MALQNVYSRSQGVPLREIPSETVHCCWPDEGEGGRVVTRLGTQRGSAMGVRVVPARSGGTVVTVGMMSLQIGTLLKHTHSG